MEQPIIHRADDAGTAVGAAPPPVGENAVSGPDRSPPEAPDGAVYDGATSNRARTAGEGVPHQGTGATAGKAVAPPPPDAARSGYSGAPRLPLPAAGVLLALGALLAVGVLWHCAMLFFSIAPPNGLSTRYQKQISAYVYPNFGQYWQLFAPNPLQQESDVQARVLTGSGAALAPGPWVDLSAEDYAAVLHNPFPSHVDQNMLRRAWDFYVEEHDPRTGRPLGVRGDLSAEYLKRLALQRLGVHQGGPHPAGIQFLVRFVPVAPPPWSAEAHRKQQTTSELLPWWPVEAGDCKGL